MTRPVPRLVYDRDEGAIERPTPPACRCELCAQDDMPVRTIVMAIAGVAIGTLIPFAWDAHGMVVVLASMVGVRL